MTPEMWALVGGASVVALVGIVFLWRRKPLYRWYCRRCKKIVASGRLHPGKCACGAKALEAYFCRVCASWNTSPNSNWHCNDCRSTSVIVGVEYHALTGLWRWRNKGAKSSALH